MRKFIVKCQKKSVKVNSFNFSNTKYVIAINPHTSKT